MPNESQWRTESKFDLTKRERYYHRSLTRMLLTMERVFLEGHGITKTDKKFEEINS